MTPTPKETALVETFCGTLKALALALAGTVIAGAGLLGIVG